MNPTSDEIPGETDVLVIGGGISGLALALATAGQGLRVTVLEANDFGAGATANSLRIVHGGLRYLQTLNLARARRSIRARREFMRFAPGLVRPVECRIPLSRWGMRSKLPISAAFLFSDLLAWDRNAGLAGGNRLPATRVWKPAYLESQRDASERVPAAAWWDAVVTQPHRLVVQLVQACNALDVRTCNHLRVTELVLDGDRRVAGVRAQRASNGAPITLKCKVAVDTTGHGGRSFRKRTPALKPVCDWVGGANFLIDERTTDTWAKGLRTRERDGLNDGKAGLGKTRDFFFVPTPAGLMAGTTYVCLDPDDAPTQAQQRAFEQLLDEINRARPGRPVAETAIKHLFWGLLPAERGASGSASSRLLERDLIVDGAKTFGLPGYYRVQGVKFTTAFELAADVVPMIQSYCSSRGRTARPNESSISRTEARADDELFSQNDPGRINEALAAMSEENAAKLVAYCIRSEYAKTLEDLLQRRLGLLPADYPDEPLRQSLAAHMAATLGWTEERTVAELSQAASTIAASPLTPVPGGHTVD